MANQIKFYLTNTSQKSYGVRGERVWLKFPTSYQWLWSGHR